jgi:hypothetical protein
MCLLTWKFGGKLLTISKRIDSKDNITIAYNAALYPDAIELDGFLEPVEKYHKFLYYLAQISKPKVVVELGVKHGTGIGHLIAGYPQVLIAIGVDKQWVELPAHVEHDAVLIMNDSVEFLNNYDGAPIDIIHIDTEHTPEHVEAEMRGAIRHLSRNGVICIDDIWIDDQMKSWWEDCKHGTRKTWLPLLHSTGFGVITNE